MPEIFRMVIEIPNRALKSLNAISSFMFLDWTGTSPTCIIPATAGLSHLLVNDYDDVLHVLVLVPGRGFTGCVQEVRSIGLLELMDYGVLDTKILADEVNRLRYKGPRNHMDVHPHRLNKSTHFFSAYKDREGKRIEVCGRPDAASALRKVALAITALTDMPGVLAGAASR